MRRATAAAALVSAISWGKGSTSRTPSADNPYRITISAVGVASPSEIVVPPGTRVLFINNDAHRHNMTSDPHPEHTDCPELNQVGLLTTGQSRESGNLVALGLCGFHDHENPTTPLCAAAS